MAKERKLKIAAPITFNWDNYAVECEEKSLDLVTKQEMFSAIKDSLNSDPEWTGKFPEMTMTSIKLLYNHFMYVLGNFLIDEERSVKLDDIGILSLKFRKARQGVAPYSFIRVDGTEPARYESRPKRVMSLRRPFFFELDDHGNPITKK